MNKARHNYAFIDSQNLNLGIISQGWSLDFARFRTHLKDKYRVEKAFLFIGFVPQNLALYEYLQRSGYICVFKPVLELSHGRLKGNVDAELVLHAMICLGEYERAVLVTGDGDFFCLAEYLIRQDKLEVILIPNRLKYSGLLKSRHVVPYLRFVQDARGKVEKKGRPS